MSAALPTTEPRRVRAITVFTVVGLAALGAAPFVSDVVRDARVPEPAAIAVATRAIADGFEPGDAVVVTPSWYTLPWHGLEKVGPGTETWPYPALFLSEDIDPMDALGYSRLWVLAAFGRDPAPPELIAAAATERTDIGLAGADDVALARYRVAGVKRLRTLSKDRPALVVRRGPDGGAMTPCKFRGGEHRCGREPWLDLGLAERIVYHRQVQWLMPHPAPGGELLEIDWKDLPAGGTWLYVRCGWTMEAVRRPEGSETDVVILVDGAEVDRFTLAPRRYWMERRAILLNGTGPAALTTVTFRVSALDNQNREIMMEADVVDVLAEPLRRWATAVVE